MSEEKCPFCGGTIDWADLPEPFDDGHTQKCGWCEKKFYISAIVEYIIETNCEDNNDKHEWQVLGSLNEEFDVQVCKKCDEVR